MPGPIFTQQPRANISELRLEYFSASTTSEYTQSSTGQVSYKFIGGQPMLEASGFAFGRNFIGGTVLVPNPQNITPSTGSATIVDGYSTQYETTIVQILNSNLAIVSPPYVFKVEQNSDSSQPSLKYNFVVSEFDNSDYTASFRKVQADPSVGSFNFQSYADIEIADIFPISGDISYVRTLMRTTGFRNFDTIGEEDFEAKELFVNFTSSNKSFVNVGQILNNSHKNFYWVGSLFGGSAGSTSISKDDSVLLNALKVAFSNVTPIVSRDDFFVKVTSTNPINIYKDNDYIISFKLAAHASSDWDGSVVKDPKISIHLSGSAIRSVDRDFGKMLDEIQAPTQGTASILGNKLIFENQFDYNVTDETLTKPTPLSNIEPLSITDNTSNQGTVNNILAYRFKADTDGQVNPVFRINTGVWYISDISIKPYTLDGRNASHFRTLARIPSYQQNDRLDIKLEFYNENNEIANVTFMTSSLFFTGSNVYMNGGDNFLAGNMFIGNPTSFMNGEAINNSDNAVFQISGSSTYYSQNGIGEIVSTASASFDDITLGGSSPGSAPYTPPPPPTT